MTDKRDICERLEDQSIDGAIYLRFNAAKEIRYLRYYVARLEGDLAKAETDLEKAWGYSSKQAIDIVTLGQEVGRLREALENLLDEQNGPPLIGLAASWQAAIDQARAALAEKEEK